LHTSTTSLLILTAHARGWGGQYVDVTDDYDTERKQVLRAGRIHKFSRDDYVLKALVGAASPKIDSQDEAHHTCTVL
jgi:hypothetical protein